jgi:hypothetical protein
VPCPGQRSNNMKSNCYLALGERARIGGLI